MLFRKNMGCLSQKMSPLEVISTDQWNLSFFSAFLEQRMNKYGMIKLVEQRSIFDKNRIKELKLLSCSLYIELHDLLLLISVLTQKYDTTMHNIIKTFDSQTRQSKRNELEVP